jgi:hypothetical protein
MYIVFQTCRYAFAYEYVPTYVPTCNNNQGWNNGIEQPSVRVVPPSHHGGVRAAQDDVGLAQHEHRRHLPRRPQLRRRHDFRNENIFLLFILFT